MSKMMQIYNNIISLKNQVNYIISRMYDAINSDAVLLIFSTDLSLKHKNKKENGNHLFRMIAVKFVVLDNLILP